MGSSWDDVHWAADCLRERVDSATRRRADAEDVGKTYTEIRKRAEKRGAEATVHAGGVSVHYRGKTKTVRTHDELDAFLGQRADADDPCREGYEQAGTKEKDGRTVPNCVEADEQRADAAELPEDNAWVQRAQRQVICDTGQLGTADRKLLDRAVSQGLLEKWRGHWHPNPGANYGIGPLKTCYGPKGSQAMLARQS